MTKKETRSKNEVGGKRCSNDSGTFLYLFKKIVMLEGQPLASRKKQAKRGGDLALSEESPGMLAHDIPRLCNTLNASNASRYCLERGCSHE